MAFAHLHVHTEYSLLDGAGRISTLIERARELNMRHLAITDHGVMYGVVDFYKAAKEAGVHPVIGCEVYVAQNAMEDKGSAEREYAHLLLLAENMTGYRNLVKLVSLGFTKGFYYKPRIDYNALEQFKDGLIVLSACLSGDIPRLIAERQYDQAKALAVRLRDMLGPEHFYLELQDAGIEPQRRVNASLLKLSKEIGVPVVATNDVHYVYREDAPAQEVLMCIQTGKTLDDPNRMHFDTDQLYLKSEEEMAALFPDCPEALENSERIARRCEVSFTFGKTYLPHFQLPRGEESALDYLKKLCEQGITWRYGGEPKPDVRERLEYELSVISGMGYVDYFLIVGDFIRFAREQGIAVGPGRGSGAGSMVAYLTGITSIDPLEYDLIFERFLNPERISMPDIDSDFCYERRQEVIDYVTRKYGEDRVAQIITFGTMAARAVVRDVGRVLGMPYGDVDRIAKMIPFELKMTIERALKANPELRTLYEDDPAVEKLIDFCKKLEGMPRHASTHAAGVVISADPLTDHVPVQLNEESLTTQFPMTTLEELGLLKMDFLGLRTLTVLRDCADMVHQGTGERIDLDHMVFNDPAVYEMLSDADTDGVFQLESGGMRAFMKELKPSSFEDIIAGIALYRPGPMEYIPKYIEGKINPSSVRYDHPLMAGALSVTYGCMVYQEQVMQIVRDLAGYTLGRSDLVRRMMSKKKHEQMERERKVFLFGLEENGRIVVPGAIRMGIPEITASKIFDDISAFANYAFPKAHAAAYAVVAYQTAYLKAHYPVAFMAALLNSIAGNTDKVAAYIQYCRKKGIRVLPPDINKSGTRFRVEDGCIRFGLGAIKNVGYQAMDQIVGGRAEGGAYQDFEDFLRRQAESGGRKLVESLIKAGALDALGLNRSQMLSAYEKIIDAMLAEKKRNIAGQISLFDALGEPPPSAARIPEMPEYPLRHLLTLEKETTGIYISGHPLDEYRRELEAMTCQSEMLRQDPEEEGAHAVRDGQIVLMGGIVTECRMKSTKSNQMMAFVTIEDFTGTAESLVFPSVYRQYSDLLQIDQPICIRGRISMREEEDGKLIAEEILPLSEAAQPFKKIFLRIQPEHERMIDEICRELSLCGGEIPVFFYYTKQKKTYAAPEGCRCPAGGGLLDRLGEMIGSENVKCV